MGKIAILESHEYVAYYLKKMKGTHIPVTLNDNIRALLDSFGVNAIGILDYLTLGELKVITEKAFLACSQLLRRIDSENGFNYEKLFGTKELRLMDVATGYLFKRFTIAAQRLVCGLEAIVKRHNISEIAYLHDGKPRIVCAAWKERGFFFHDDITWEVLNNWRIEGKPGLAFVKACRNRDRRYRTYAPMRVKYNMSIRKVKEFLSPLKKAMLCVGGQRESGTVASRRTLLFLTPLYDFAPILDSETLKRDYNILAWNACKTRIELPDIKSPLSLKWKGCEDEGPFTNLNLDELALPLMKEFYNKKISDIFRYWQEAKYIDSNYDVMALLWGNGPLRYPHAIMKEYFRIKGLPIFGMQHGGATGSNSLGSSIFETDFNHCNYYLSYGFREEDLELNRSIEKPAIIPVGSTVIKRMSFEYQKSGSARRREFDIIFPLSLVLGTFYHEYEFSNPRLFEFQKKIIDAMAGFSGKKILLKFSVGSYYKNPMGIYIEKKYPGKFAIVDHISFAVCLKKFEAKTILIEEQSTPLNEALITRSNIIVYNDETLAGLTARARKLLAKRAIICDSEEAFLTAVRKSLEGSIEERDMNNREFLERYCIYKGDPENNIENAIRSLAADGREDGTRDLVYAE